MSEGQQASIMPLVEENRKLHDEVRALKVALAAQNVRVDEMLANSQFKSALAFVDVELPQATLLFEPHEASRALSRQLAEKLIAEVPRIAQRVESASLLGADLTYRFAFWKAGRP